MPDRTPLADAPAGDALPPDALVHVAASGIHGRGLFARAPIPADTLILTIEGRATTEDGTYVIWTEEEDGTLEGFEITNAARYVNHSPRPNAAFYDFELWSLRPIRAGEEITHHYGPAWDEDGAEPSAAAPPAG